MADGELQAKFDREFRAQIERFHEPLVKALRKLITAPLPVGEFDVLSFEMQADWRDFPVYAFAMDREAINEMYYEPPFKGKLLPKAGRLIPKQAIDQDDYQRNGIATYERGARLLAEWFGVCWHTAGGTAFPLPAYINLHDSSKYFDLHVLRWIHAREIGQS